MLPPTRESDDPDMHVPHYIVYEFLVAQLCAGVYRSVAFINPQTHGRTRLVLRLTRGKVEKAHPVMRRVKRIDHCIVYDVL